VRRTPDAYKASRFHAELARAEAALVRRYLRRAGGCVIAAARLSGLNRTHFYKLMRKHGIAPKFEGSGNRSSWLGLADR
jgi:transcriptional regulator of acetoin/glycerol metabolism